MIIKSHITCSVWTIWVIIIKDNFQCFCSVTQSCLTLWEPMDCSAPGFTVLHNILEFAQTHFHWVGDVIQPTHNLLLPSSPAPQFFPALGSFPVSRSFPVDRFQWVAKILEFHLQLQSFNEYSGLIFFMIDWFDLLAVQRILKSFLQYHNSKTSILQHSAFIMVQLQHPYMTTGRTIALTMWAFVSKVTYLLFNMLSRFVITFLPRNKWLFISWL